MSAQSGEMSAQSSEMSAQSKGTPKQTRVGVSAQSGQKSAQSPLQRARPTPTPTPTPTPEEPLRKTTSSRVPEKLSKKSAAAATNGHHVEVVRWPQAADFLTNKFPRTEPVYINRLGELAVEAITKAGGNPSLFTDEAFREALKQATFNNQQSAAGYLKTLPVLVANWSKSK